MKKEFYEIFLKTLKFAEKECPPEMKHVTCYGEDCLSCWIEHCERKIKELEE